MQEHFADSELIQLISETQFGSIRNFKVCDGLPVISEETEVSLEYKLSGIESAREVIDRTAFLAKPQVKTMLQRFRQLRNATVECLDVRDGLPFKMVVKHKAHS